MENSHVERKAGVLVAVVFVLGILLGGTGTHYWEARAMGNRSTLPPTHAEVLHQLHTQLSLTPDQQTQIDAIVEDTHQKLHALWVEQKPQYDSYRADGRKRIRALLNPDQQPKYDAFVKHLDEERAKVDGPR